MPLYILLTVSWVSSPGNQTHLAESQLLHEDWVTGRMCYKRVVFLAGFHKPSFSNPSSSYTTSTISLLICQYYP